mmetsp:Transcript_22086/g.35454  ORF Transcript_22086/g.35454 Transcript_22086/m.35454 type:complete len:92 (+) Transcript_22086:824-1099(+)
MPCICTEDDLDDLVCRRFDASAAATPAAAAAMASAGTLGQLLAAGAKGATRRCLCQAAGAEGAARLPGTTKAVSMTAMASALFQMGQEARL